MKVPGPDFLLCKTVAGGDEAVLLLRIRLEMMMAEEDEGELTKPKDGQLEAIKVQSQENGRYLPGTSRCKAR